MQPPTEPPRDLLTAAAVQALIQDAPALVVGCGAELLDLGLNVLDDLTDDLAGGSVNRAAYANLHGTATLSISRDLDWGRAIVRPFMTLSDGTATATFRLGAYYTSTPNRHLGDNPVTYEVDCYDILSILDDAVGDTYAVTAGTPYLAAVETILIARGVTQYLIDQTAAASVLPTDRVFAFADNMTWLTVVNGLLGSIGYQGIWSDWNGRLRAHPYESPRTRAPEWVYSTDASSSMISPSRTLVRDFYTAPNRWIFFRQNNVDSTPPVEGDGMFTYVNQSVGDTSVDARGRTITKPPVGLDVADHTALVTAAQQTIDADMQVPTKIGISTSPNPLHWHFDRLYLVDAAAGTPKDILGTAWTLPLDGGDQEHAWTVL